MKTILQKIIAESGYCSRREAEKLIRSGRVTINGVLAEPGMRADDKDEVRVGSEKIGLQKKKIYIKLYKPKGYTCTNRKFKGEKNVFELLDGVETRLIASLHIVGRLDKDSRGLVLLTNDGELTQRLTHPKFEHEKRYLVRIGTDAERMPTDHGSKQTVDAMKKGIDIGDGDGVVRAKTIRHLSGNQFEIILTEGKKRQIRRMFAARGYKVIDIKRTAIGKLELGSLKEGEWKFLEEDEVKKIK
ncbi:hypothetical protein A2303_03025 [Candidatus Falkowbacteria bacterium RIFOXYB2_FULL_47_14]|uniref:Pseudouridine synthase n=1 Tax=Candidatus Falkowbacteria bacterium RIFOXYA2_FULL_47_19 TaxID=1797994 RepID=A0A1F5SF57_9BACT|nr:MAG: hypothetical protein A2227_07945 [Candidatus Falkowbacteria bacterium RIFOXYA2_FULL_47_19]OGF36356.1 MAG: hypothetical protein A2468_01650 [Candidatus Falkowbacteria bacterium RIFOXYC2_FULL_46_15]OGF43329.1 MAG: hypothetical protein A2303_03025 [Candidatus Falkowbacteria bacterium RIFOXYB2_FULL_47_14]